MNNKLENSMSAAKKDFLSDQRGDRIRNISGFDPNDETMNSDYETSSESECESSHSSEPSEFSFSSSSNCENYRPKKKKLKRATIEKLEEAGLSCRQMQKVVKAFNEEFESDPEDYCIGSSTFHSNSIKIRSSTAEQISSDIRKETSKVVVLFDTKTSA